MDGLSVLKAPGGNTAYTFRVTPAVPPVAAAAAGVSQPGSASFVGPGQAAIAVAPSLTPSAELADTKSLSPKLAYAPSPPPRIDFSA